MVLYPIWPYSQSPVIESQLRHLEKLIEEEKAAQMIYIVVIKHVKSR